MLVGSLAQLVTSTFGKVSIGVLVLVAWTYYQRHDAAAEVRNSMLVAFEKAKTAEVFRQKSISEVAVKAAVERARLAEAKVAEFQGVANEIDKEMQAADRNCPIDPSVRGRLLAIH